MEVSCPADQRLLRLDVVGVRHATINRTDGGTGFVVVKSHAFRTEQRINHIDFVPLADRIIGAFRFACPAVNAFTCNHRCHLCSSPEFPRNPQNGSEQMMNISPKRPHQTPPPQPQENMEPLQKMLSTRSRERTKRCKRR